MTNNYDQIVTFGKDNVEALVKSGTAAVKGLEELAKLYTVLANQSVEQSSAAMKAMTAIKSPTDFQSMYSSMATDQFNAFVAESKKVQDLASAIFTETLAPINARVQALSGLFKVAA